MRYVCCAAYFIAVGFASLTGEAPTSKIESVPPTPSHEAMFVSLNGIVQWITIRGDDARNPVILMLHGGPGFPTSELAPIFAPFEGDYTLVQWDQQGGGSTYARNMGKDFGPLTVARYCSDGIALT